jgi:ketosteroid isomerase-like protein
MPMHSEALRAAFESRDLDALVGLLDERVVWRGLPADDDENAHDHLVDDIDGDGHAHEHAHAPMCTSRQEVRDVLEGFLASGMSGGPVVIAEEGDSVVVDPRSEPPLPSPLHQAFTFRGGRVVLIQDYPDRASALMDLIL